MKWLALIALYVLASIVHASPVAAQPSPAHSSAACVAAFDAAQGLRDEGKLLQSREQLVACAQVSCPSIIQQKCNEWLIELEEVTPTIVLTVEPAPERPTEVVVMLDGQRMEGVALGRPLSLDPGHHDVVVTLADGTEKRLEVVVAHGEKNRKVAVQISVPAPGPLVSPESSDQRDTTISPLLWTGFGIAAAAAIVGGVTGGMALATADDVERSCGGLRCDPSYDDDLKTGETLSHVSTASFAVAGVGAVLGVVGIVLSLESDAATAVGVRPWLGLGGAGIQGAF